MSTLAYPAGVHTERDDAMRQTLYEFCCRNDKELLLQQWDTERNAPDTPQTVSYGTHKKIWWRCDKGHSWQAPAYSRVGGSGCPYCTGKRVEQDKSLASLYPRLAAQWDTQKNAPRKPSNVSPGSHRLAWWVCEKGHSWRAQINSRVSGCGCPVCSDRRVIAGENSLADVAPELVSQWDVEKNAPLTPRQVVAGTRRKVWWKCEQGHSWRAAISYRVSQKAGCPVCGGKTVQRGFNDLASLYPALAAEWDAAKNGALSPEMVTPASNRKVWWRCHLGHSYLSVIASRTLKGCGCPYCAGRKVLAGFNDLAAKNPAVAAQWHPTLNGSLTPEMVTAGSHRKVWWQCPAGHVWKAVIGSRTGKHPCGCPVCAGHFDGSRRTRYEQLLKEVMRLNG